MSLPRNSAEEISSDSTEVFDDLDKDIQEAFDILKRVVNKLRKEKEDLYGARKELKDKKIKLDVGGHLFSTSKETLMKDPVSMLHAMFSERFETKLNEDGSYFIDRDGTHFRYILNYLRTWQLIVPEDEIVRREILAEVEYYQIEGIINELTPKLFKESEILSPDQQQTLINWLKETGTLTNTNLLYRASRDGWAAFNFHSCCDKKGPTVTVVKSGNYIFGGYTEEQWESERGSPECWKKAPDSFLFSLVNPSGVPPKKMPLKAEHKEFAIYCDSRRGPTFGFGNDLCIFDPPNTNNGVSRLNDSYQCPTGQKQSSFLTGNENFTIGEMEVFGFEK